jgi:uncharacterized NAD(P)/FAD-binding protein YdhS
MTRTVLILGASYAGLTIAHKLLKHTRPSVPDLIVILVNPSTHFYWNLASVRAIIPGQIKDEGIFQDIAQGFKYAPKDALEFVVGTAESVDIEAKEVSVRTGDGQRKKKYDLLVVATGSKTAGTGKVPWKASGSYEEMREELHEMQRRVEEAKSIVVVGGGATGVELAGELGFEYHGRKDIQLVGLDRNSLFAVISFRPPRNFELPLWKAYEVIRSSRGAVLRILPNTIQKQIPKIQLVKFNHTEVCSHFVSSSVHTTPPSL